MWELLAAGAKSTVPKLVEGTLRLVGVKLLGKALEYPEAWMDGHVQSLRDRTRAASIFSDTVSAEIAKLALTHTPALSAIADDMLHDHLRKIRNKGAILLAAIENVSSGADQNASVTCPTDDWMAAFGRITEDISASQMRDTFARILAGEICQNGSFSISTLRYVSGMNQTVASEFSDIGKELIGDHIFRAPKYQLGADWNRMRMLRDEGLFSPVDSAVHQPNGPPASSDGKYYWSYGHGSNFLRIEYTPGSGSQIQIFNLTNMGIEVARLLSSPDIDANLRQVAVQNPQRAGWMSVDLCKNGLPVERVL